MSRQPLGADQAEICVYDSLLSEAPCRLDYGYSLDEPHIADPLGGPVGDFANGAQVIIDQFIASGESKWNRASGLVMLLPHGRRPGSRALSAPSRRFLALCRGTCRSSTRPSRPVFHVRRRQVRADSEAFVVMTPKACSGLSEPLAAGRFHQGDACRRDRSSEDTYTNRRTRTRARRSRSLIVSVVER